MSVRSRSRNRSLERKLIHAIREMAPTILALSLAGVAHAKGTMDFSGAQTLMGKFKIFAIYAGAVICFGGLSFAGIRMISGRFQDAIPGLFGVLFGAGVLGRRAGWIGPYQVGSSPDGRSAGIPRAAGLGRPEVQHRPDRGEGGQISRLRGFEVEIGRPCPRSGRCLLCGSDWRRPCAALGEAARRPAGSRTLGLLQRGLQRRIKTRSHPSTRPKPAILDRQQYPVGLERCAVQQARRAACSRRWQCADCSKRTGHNKLLFGDDLGRQGDRCLFNGSGIGETLV